MTSGPLTQLRNKLLYYNHFCFCACTDVTAGNRDMRFLANRFFCCCSRSYSADTLMS